MNAIDNYGSRRAINHQHFVNDVGNGARSQRVYSIDQFFRLCRHPLCPIGLYHVGWFLDS